MGLSAAGMGRGEVENLRHDFAPDLLAIQDRPPPRLPRAVGLTVVAASALMLLWAALAKVDVVATAEGRLVPMGFVKVVQSADAGVVQDILVADGSQVLEGQVLARLDRRTSEADSDALAREVWLRRLGLQRVETELAGAAMFRPTLPAGSPAWLPGLASQVQAQFQARRQAQLNAVAQERESLNKARADLAAARQVLTKLTSTLPAFQQSARAFERLVKEGYVGELAANEKAREALEREQDLQTQAATVEGLRAAIAQGEVRLASIEAQYRAQLQDERVELQSQLTRSEPEWERARVRNELLEVRAPQAGIVKDLAVTTKGAVVQAGSQLMTVVPDGAELQAEVQLKNEDAGFVAAGQAARIKIAAFPFQKYGLLDGQVRLVGADAVDPRAAAPTSQAGNGSSPWTYRAWVTLGSNRTGSQSLALQPGMAVVAEIHQGERTVLEYLLSPVQRITQEAARER